MALIFGMHLLYIKPHWTPKQLNQSSWNFQICVTFHVSCGFGCLLGCNSSILVPDSISDTLIRLIVPSMVEQWSTSPTPYNGVLNAAVAITSHMRKQSCDNNKNKLVTLFEN